MPLMPQNQALRLKSRLMDAAISPRELAPLINVGTTAMLEVLERKYFESDLANGVSCFKYLEGDYGTGKTQFINCLAERAHKHQIVTAIVDIGQECPFSSPLQIFKHVASSLIPPADMVRQGAPGKGVEALIMAWINGELRKLGVEHGAEVPDIVRQQIERPFRELWLGAPDTQMAAGLAAMGMRLVANACGVDLSYTDSELISWIRGETVRSNGLKKEFGLHEPANDINAFQRLKTLIVFCRERLHFRGFFVAFDEGTRTMSFRRGSVKQRQAIENMLTMINQNTDGEFGGTMFLYAATPDFRTEVIQTTYIALRDRIGATAFAPGRPMTPLIKLDEVNSDENLIELGSRIVDVFASADGFEFDRQIQSENIVNLIEAEKQALGYLSTVPPRFFVMYFCRLLDEQRNGQRVFTVSDAIDFVEKNKMPDPEAA